MSHEYDPVAQNDGDEAAPEPEKEKRAYALSAVMLLLFSILILSAHANLQSSAFVGGGYKGVYLSSSVITMFGCVLALLFYCCELPNAIKFVIGLIVFVGGLLYFIGGIGLATTGGPVKTCYNNRNSSGTCRQLEAYYLALPFLVLFESTILAMQIGSEMIQGEKRRIRAQVFALFTYGLIRAIFWYGFYQAKLTSAEKSAEASLFILMVSCLVVFLFHGLCCNIEAKWFRVTNVIVMTVAAFMYLVTWAVLAGQYNSYGMSLINPNGPPTSAQKLKLVTPAIFVFMETVNLAVEVGYVG